MCPQLCPKLWTGVFAKDCSRLHKADVSNKHPGTRPNIGQNDKCNTHAHVTNEQCDGRLHWGRQRQRDVSCHVPRFTYFSQFLDVLKDGKDLRESFRIQCVRWKGVCRSKAGVDGQGFLGRC